MEIVKELNLNKNPQGVKVGSLINAWNIKLSPDCSYITSDDSIHDVIEGKISGNIVGVIPCNKEFVVLTNNNKIYRFQEDDNGDIKRIIDCPTSWKWSSGTIKGTYTYNVNGELIITIVESNVDVPLKTINLDKAKSTDHQDQYGTAPNAPIVNMTLVDRIGGNVIPQGIYQFFIRFKCQDETYTNWFPIGVPQYAVARKPATPSLGTYVSGTNSVPNTLLNDNNLDCPYSFKFRFTIHHNNEYKRGQLGYILQHDNGVVCRKWHEIELHPSDGKDIFNLIFDGTNPQEEDINSMLNNVLNLTNVKNITTYENRLYIANYKESNYDVEESALRTVADRIQVNQYMSDASKFAKAGDGEAPDEPGGGGEEEEITDYIYRVTGVDASGNETYQDITVGKNYSTIRLSDYSSSSPFAVIRNMIKQSVIPTQDVPLPSRIWFTYFTQPPVGTEVPQLTHVYMDENSSQQGIEENQVYIKLPNDREIGYEQRLILYDGPNDELTSYEFFYGQTVEAQGIHAGDPRIDVYHYDPANDSNNYGSKLAPHIAATEHNNGDDIRCGYWVCGGVEDETQSQTYDMILGFYLKCSDIKITKIGVVTSGGVIHSEVGYTTTSRIENTDYAIRTLMPNEVYAFFVHYVRKDGSYTNGIQLFNSGNTSQSDATDISQSYVNNKFKNFEGLKNCELFSYGITENTETSFRLYTNINGDKLFYTCNGYCNGYKPGKIVPIFRNVQIPSGYIGVFFSYAKVESLNLYYAYTRPVIDNNHLVEYKASEVETGICTYIGSIYDEIVLGSSDKYPDVITKSNIYISNLPNRQYDESESYNIDTNNKSQISTFGIEGAIGHNVFTRDGLLKGNPSGYAVVNVRRHDNSIYTDKEAILVSFGQILYGDNNTSYCYGEANNSPIGNEEFNYPSFVCKDKVFLYKERIYFSDDGRVFSPTATGFISGEGDDRIGVYVNTISCIEVAKHSNYNLDALTIKKEPEFVVKGNESGITGSVYIIKPINMSDFLMYPGTFIEQQHKIYGINDEQRYVAGHSTSVIRRSSVLADESLENTLRYFNPSEYKVIPKDKGNITNLVGLGYMFLIHTEHTLYVISRDNLLKGASENVQVETPSVFDIDPKEMFSSTHGYGGLQTDSWTTNANGYFFYDKDSIEIYNVDGEKLNNLTLPVKRLLSKFNPDDAAFVTDFDNNRVIMCFRNKSSNTYMTLSYNILSNSFISLHSYCFNYGYNTKNRPYIRLDNSNKLGTTNTITNISYRNYSSWYNVANANGLLKVTAANYNKGSLPSVIEVIFNNFGWEVHTFEFVSWIIKLIRSWSNSLETNMVEEEDYSINGNERSSLDRKDWYSGEILRIYSDLTDSLDLNIETPGTINQFNNYKYPYFDRGAWNLNYFRNHYNAEQVTPVSAGKSISDNRGLIYGRYFVLRFIFGSQAKYNLPFKFNEVNINIK